LFDHLGVLNNHLILVSRAEITLGGKHAFDGDDRSLGRFPSGGGLEVTLIF